MGQRFMSMNWTWRVCTVSTQSALVSPSVGPSSAPSHCTTVQNSLNMKHLIPHYPMNLRVGKWMKEWTSEWPNSYIPIFGRSKQPCTDQRMESHTRTRCRKTMTTKPNKSEYRGKTCQGSKSLESSEKKACTPASQFNLYQWREWGVSDGVNIFNIYVFRLFQKLV